MLETVVSFNLCWPMDFVSICGNDLVTSRQDLGENHKREMEGGTLGSPAAMELMKKLRPPFWFSASLQVRPSKGVSYILRNVLEFLELMWNDFSGHDVAAEKQMPNSKSRSLMEFELQIQTLV